MVFWALGLFFDWASRRILAGSFGLTTPTRIPWR